MIAENTEEKKIVGLLPMGLAETNNDGRNGQKCYSIIQKVLAIISLILIVIAFYLLILRLLQSDNNVNKTELIVLSGFHEEQNVSILQDEIEILLRLKNITSKVNPSERKKRETLPSTQILKKDNKFKRNIKFKDNQKQKAKKIIAEHEFLCNEEYHKESCKELVMKLKSLTENNLSNHRINKEELADIIQENIRDGVKDNLKTISSIKPTDVSKRETNPLHITNSLRPIKSVPYDTYHFDNSEQIHGTPQHSMINSRDVLNPQLTETCLLKRLMRQSYPNLQGIFDTPHHEYQQLIPSYPRQFSSDFISSYVQNRGIDAQKHKPHPQDIEIAMKFFAPKHDIAFKEAPSNTSINEVECPIGTISCESGSFCVDEKNWCDGNVDCDDVSDESRCSCKSRVDESRKCDGYFDCPFGEDEMGCYGCSEDTFSCEDLHFNFSTCFSKEQRCNNIVDCPNHKDEIDCTMLAPSLHKKPLFAVSNTDGYLHRNYKGNWYAVCSNPYMWAHDACRRETGLIIRPPFIQILQIDPLLKVNYISTAPGGLLHTSNTCLNSSAVYVTCPDLLCGTRILTATQQLKENAGIENHLFGRNKRYLLQRHPQPMKFYGGRMKRNVGNKSVRSEIPLNHLSDGKIDEVRIKRAQGRVVGGKPSQPAAWPWMVALYRDGMFHCGGVIINQNWVMSAAHCVNKFWQYYYEVQVGMLRRFSFSPQEQNHRVTHIIVNHNYNQEDMKNDLSLLRVKPAIQFSRWVRPVCLPSPEVAGADWMWGPPAGTICTAVGWGATVERGPDPDHMREVEVPIWEKCKHQDDQDGNEICAGLVEGGRDTCQGDSGGPLLCRNPMNTQQWYVAGIVSHGDGCARKGEPGVYTRVSLFVSWIRYHTSSKTLPMLQPKQECPGFRCDSGILKCLPKKRMCDKIIDCLDGEDEYNCDVARSSVSSTITEPITRLENATINNYESLSMNNSILNHENNSLTHETSIEYVTESKYALNLTEVTTTTSYITFSNSGDQDADKTVSNLNTIPNSDNAKNLISPFSVTQSLKPNTEITKLEEDMKQASFIEMANMDYSQEYGIEENIDDSVTIDPIKITTTTSEMMEQKAINIKTYPLESMSLEKTSIQGNYNINSELRETITTALPSETKASTTYYENDEKTTNKMELDDFLQASTESNTNNESIKIYKSDISSETDQNSNEFIIELLPYTNVVTEKSDVLDTNSTTNHISDQIISESANVEHNTHNIKQLDTKGEVVTNIIDIMLSELQPAKIRKKHLTPIEFQCRRIYQIVPFATRCNHKADCEDGTDELDCTCLDYLTSYDNKLICDGNFDCADGQDELDCYSCEEDQFLCKQSQICLPSNKVCDGKPQCPLGEDELDCLALSNGKYIDYNLNDRPKVALEGYLTKKRNGNWHIVCEDNLSIQQQEESASHMCRYLGFSSANRFMIKYINLKGDLVNSKEKNKSKRDIDLKVPVSFAYQSNNDSQSNNYIIKNPEVIKEECVPNITKTCMALYIYCDHSLYTNFEKNTELLHNHDTYSVSNRLWPWIAKLYIDGKYICMGVLVDLSWVLMGNSCLKSATLSHHFISVSLGSHKTLGSIMGPYEQVYQIDAKKDLYRSKVILLHLKQPAVYSTMVKPMVVISSYFEDNKNIVCVAVGQDKNNETFNVFLKETDECDLHNRCFIIQPNSSVCHPMSSQWVGIISCHTKQGWYPAASFIINKEECSSSDRIIGTDIGNLKHEIKYYEDPVEQNMYHECEGIRCKRGKCIKLRKICDGVTDCEDGVDESKEACKKKSFTCDKDPHYRGCECPVGQLKCHNGQCIFKELFKDGHDDCGDGTDEPGQTTCSDYLSRVMPSRLCDGILHCHDRSDEDPMFCKCFAKEAYKCSQVSNNEEYCVANDMVCDGIRDCPNGEDERTCIGLRSPEGTPYGVGEVIVRSHGIWYSKCFPKQNHTRSELEEICRTLGFIGGHAKQLAMPRVTTDRHNSVVVDTFSNITLNMNTTIKLRNSHTPIARAVVDEKENCYPVFIECL
ncbi:serine protease nudel [Nymphalis io]|uniref:serine protease nudel n=1 Tax=Inachis io TaxID=171585 RepID=UPI002167F142|nr:serine protease nudel [Nymphalis io]